MSDWKRVQRLELNRRLREMEARLIGEPKRKHKELLRQMGYPALANRHCEL